MSTAQRVPETFELTGDDARETLLRCGRRRLVADAYQRLRSADGFSHARSLAYALTLVLVQSIIATVGLARTLGKGGITDVIVRTLEAAAPGPAGELLTDAVQQANEAGASREYLGLTFGLLGAIVTGATVMGQMERAVNRLYGIEQDRPTVEKYTRAVVLALTAGGLSVVGFVALALGRAVGDGLDDSAVADAWAFARWPLALVATMAAMALLFRLAPNRRQPAWSWLAFGATVSVAGWFVVTVALAGFFRLGTSFGDTYGPLAGLVALLLWAFLSSVAVLLGAAVAAQLEAVRAGASQPEDATKNERPALASQTASAAS